MVVTTICLERVIILKIHSQLTKAAKKPTNSSYIYIFMVWTYRNKIPGNEITAFINTNGHFVYFRNKYGTNSHQVFAKWCGSPLKALLLPTRGVYINWLLSCFVHLVLQPVFYITLRMLPKNDFLYMNNSDSISQVCFN